MKPGTAALGLAPLAVLAFAWATHAHVSDAGHIGAKFLCNVHGLTSAQRIEHKALMLKLKSSVRESRELEDGFAFRVDTAGLDLADLSRWVELERRCCPFFHFGIDVEANEGPTWLHLTGAQGVKAFIQTAMAEG